MQHRRVKIVATIGPASSAPEILREMMRAGMDVVRLNCSHSTHEELSRRVPQIRELSREEERPIGILLDLSGPKLRTGPLEGGGPVDLVPGREIRIGPGRDPGSAERVGCTYPHLARDLEIGARVLIDDGLLELEVLGIEGAEVRCRVLVGGPLHERKGLNLPDTDLPIPALTEKDRADLAHGLSLGVDFVALSFVQRGEDMVQLRQEIERLGHDVPIIAKLERPRAVENLDEILGVTDAVMVARGDLGVEAGAHRVPMMQKKILHRATRRAVVDITATQMLDSMIRNPRPTRAEASDVANAILDGSDAVMLSGETAVGRYPLEAIRMMHRIALEVESVSPELPSAAYDEALQRDEPVMAIAEAACLLARHRRYRAIIVLTDSGATAHSVAAFRPLTEIYALTPRAETVQRLTIVRGVQPIHVSFEGDTDDILAAGEAVLRQRELLDAGDTAILVSGQLDGWGITHVLKIFTVRAEGEQRDRPFPSARAAPTREFRLPRGG